MADAPNTETTPKQQKEKVKPELPHCGVIMPISGTIEYTAEHWAEMLQLIKESAKEAKYTCEIVSATGRDDIIHASIVTNIYQNEIVVCDVSSRNPNVMLELGLRLASKLPIVIIFDGEGNYPFDIGTIRYLRYRKDMRYYDMEKFKKELTIKILEVQETYQKGTYKSFLSHFKNVDFDLDTISTETQGLTQFLESIDKRLNNIEEQGQEAKYKGLKSTSQRTDSMIDKAMYSFMKRFTLENNIPDDAILSSALLETALSAIRTQKNSILNNLSNTAIMSRLEAWNDAPF